MGLQPRIIKDRFLPQNCGYGFSENVHMQVYETRGGDDLQVYVQCIMAPTPGSGGKDTGGG